MVDGERPQSRVLLFVVKPLGLPSLVDHFRRGDLVGLKEEEARRRVAGFLRKPGPAEKVELPARTASRSAISPSPSPSICSVARTRWRRSMRRSSATRGGSRLWRSMGSVASGRRRLRRLMRSAIAANIARRGGCGRKRRIPCAPISSRWPSGSAGSQPTRRRRPAFDKVMVARGRGLLIIYDKAIQADALKPVPAQRRRSPRTRHLQRARLASRCRPDRIEAVGQTHRRGLSDRAHGPGRGVFRRGGAFRSARRPATPPRTGRRLSRAALCLVCQFSRAAWRRRRSSCSMSKETRRSSIITSGPWRRLLRSARPPSCIAKVLARNS